MSKRIRVLVANRPRFLRESILDLLAHEPDIEVVGEVTEPAFENIETVIAQTQPEFLILGLEKIGGRASLHEAVLQRHPGIKILMVSDNHESSVLYWANVDIRSTPLESSEMGLLKTLPRGRGSGEPGRVM